MSVAESKGQAEEERDSTASSGGGGNVKTERDGDVQPEPRATLWRMGRHVDLCANELVANTALVGRFSVTAVHDLSRPLPLPATAAVQQQENQKKPKHKIGQSSAVAGGAQGAGTGTGAGRMRLFRAQGVAVPTEFLVHHATFEVLRARAARLNARLPFPTPLPLPISSSA